MNKLTNIQMHKRKDEKLYYSLANDYILPFAYFVWRDIRMENFKEKGGSFKDNA